MNEPKRHHFLPQKSYQQNFTQDGKFWVYDKKLKKCHPGTPLNTGVEGYYYSYTDQEGNKRNEVEGYLGKVENRGIPIVHKLLNRNTVSAEEKSDYALFLALLFTRVPDFERMTNHAAELMLRTFSKQVIANVDEAKKFVDRFAKETGITVDPKAYFEFVQNDRYKLKFDRANRLIVMLELAVHISRHLENMDWYVFHSENNAAFITTDAPFVFVDPFVADAKSLAAMGMLLPRTKKIVPLGSSCCLVISETGDQITHKTVSKETVMATNITVAGRAERFIIGHDEHLLRDVVNQAFAEQSS